MSEAKPINPDQLRSNYGLADSGIDLQAAQRVWNDVFVTELGETIPENPWGSEPGAQIFVSYDSKMAVGVAQLTPLEQGTMQVEHVAVLQSHRGKKIGQALIEKMVQVAQVQMASKVVLSARTDAQVFYQKLGFESAGKEFEAFGSPHIMMHKRLTHDLD